MYRLETGNSPEEILRLVEIKCKNGISSALSDRIKGTERFGIAHYNLTEAERTELMKVWGDGSPPLSDYQLVKDYEQCIYEQFFDEWFDYFNTYMNSDLQV